MCHIAKKNSYSKEIKAFDCGNKHFTDFINCADDYGTAYLFVERQDNGNNNLIGFVSYCCGSLKLEGDVCPAVEIKLFAVDKKYQGQKIGNKSVAQYIMDSCFMLFNAISVKYIRADYVLLHSTDERATAFYSKIGFKEISNEIVVVKDGEIIENIDSNKSLSGMFETNCKAMFISIKKN